jgi:hypothetical protein
MSRRLAVRIVVPFAAAAAFAAAIASSGSAQAPSARTITLLELSNKTRLTYVDNAKHGPSAGDIIDFIIPVVDPATRKRLGDASATCSVLRFRKSSEPTQICHGIFTLADGAIVVSGLLGPKGVQFAVVGGTGAYAGARGTMTSTDHKTTTTDVITLLP